MFVIAWKGSVILAAAFLAAALLRRRSAALRHFLWTAAFGALLLLPALVWQVHELPVTLPNAPLPEVTGDARATNVIDVRPVDPPVPHVPWIPILYTAGFSLAALRFLAAAARMAWMVRSGSPAPELGADVVIAPGLPIPLAWGIRRRWVILPEGARDWPAPRLSSVLLHERMHHRRLDLIALALGQATCSLFWFHPLVWLALRRQRTERERACDDAVLATGVAPHNYAAHLMEVVRAAAACRGAWEGAPAMAAAADLESRVCAVLDNTRDRRPPARFSVMAIAAVIAALLVPLSALQLRAQAVTGTISGIVRDPNGARIPGCIVTAKNLEGSNQETTLTGPVGDYRFTAIPAGHYVLEFAARGFALNRIEAELVAGAVANVDGNLTMGQISERVTVTGKKPQPAGAAQSGPVPQRIKVGGNVQPARLLNRTSPVYPTDLQAAGVEGTVLIRVVIGKDGAIMGPQVVNTAIDPRLAQAALDAVAQWQYSPTLLNGEPVETATTITIDFQLRQ